MKILIPFYDESVVHAKTFSLIFSCFLVNTKTSLLEAAGLVGLFVYNTSRIRQIHVYHVLILRWVYFLLWVFSLLIFGGELVCWGFSCGVVF